MIIALKLFAILLAVPMFLVCLNKFVFKNKLRKRSLIFFHYIFFYFFWVIIVYASYNVNFDKMEELKERNKNGEDVSIEINETADRISNDLGVTWVTLTGLITSLFPTGMYAGILLLSSLVTKSKINPLDHAKINQAKQIAIDGMSFNIVKKSKYFPPIYILNDFLQCGIDDIESNKSFEWNPFELSSEEYLTFYEWCCEQYGDLHINQLNKSVDYSEWFTRAIDH